jgi:type II secretory pathway component PulL
MARDTAEPGPLWRRLAWFVALWLAGVASVGMVAWAIRAVLL